MGKAARKILHGPGINFFRDENQFFRISLEKLIINNIHLNN